MSITANSLITIDDLAAGDFEAIFTLADGMQQDMTAQFGKLEGKILASLFFEPSTRTRLSFETAMHRLGGRVISAVDTKATSLAKGESIADMARVIGSYADIIVIRHPWEGAARVVADYAGIPVINAGDGGHQHPTQTLLDLYTIKRERKTIRGLKIALWGDLKYGRTVHSLIFALAKMEANILFCPRPGLEVPDHIIEKLVAEYGGEVERPDRKAAPESRLPLDAVYITPGSPHQLAMMPNLNIQVELQSGVDALYVTRAQKERFSETETGGKGTYSVVDKEMLREEGFKKTLIMHPLPRVDELACELDTDPRSMYFTQAALGVPVRMAIITLMLGAATVPTTPEEETAPEFPEYSHDTGLCCPNPRCVSVQATETKY